jgi:hypothetical protein
MYIGAREFDNWRGLSYHTANINQIIIIIDTDNATTIACLLCVWDFGGVWAFEKVKLRANR